jgi:hypothetical protein
MSQYTIEQEKQFLNYMRRFADRYRVRRGEDGTWELPCRHGNIEPYSLTELCCYQVFKSKQGVTWLKKSLPGYCNVTQDAGAELVFKFPNEKFEEIAALVEAKKRRILTPEQKAVAVQRLSVYKFKSHAANQSKNAVESLISA